VLTKILQQYSVNLRKNNEDYLAVLKHIILLQVWQGMTHGGQLIAVKQVELPTSSLNDAQKVYEGLQREVDILKEMRHPNIVRYQPKFFFCLNVSRYYVFVCFFLLSSDGWEPSILK